MRNAKVEGVMFVAVGFECDTVWFYGGCIGVIFDGCIFSIRLFFSDIGTIVGGDIFGWFLVRIVLKTNRKLTNFSSVIVSMVSLCLLLLMAVDPSSIILLEVLIVVAEESSILILGMGAGGHAIGWYTV